MERFKHLTTAAPDTWNPDSPVEWLKGAILLDNSTGKILLQLKLCNISNEHIKSVHLLIDGFDEMGELLCKGFKFAYQDINQAPHTVFGDQNPIYLPDDRIRKVHIHFSKVMFADSTITTIEDKDMPIPDRESITDWPDNLVNELNRVYEDYNGSFPLIYIPKELDDNWLCSCGKINLKDDNKCARCNRDKKLQFNAINKTFLQKSLCDFNQQNIKIAQEEGHQREEEKQKIASQIRLLFRIAIVIAMIGAASFLLYANFISPIIQYNNANKLLNTGSYSEAKKTFVELGNYKDCNELVNECSYRQGLSYKKACNYVQAISCFQKLKTYKDSVAQKTECDYLYASSLCKVGKYDSAIQIYKNLGKYKDSVQKIADCKYAQATANMNNKIYANAVEEFSTLGDYKDCPILIKECHYRNACDLYNNGFSKNDAAQLRNAKDLFANLANYKDSKAKIADITKALKWIGEWIVIKEAEYKQNGTQIETYGPYCNNEFMSKETLPEIITISYKEMKINEDFSPSTNPETPLVKNNNEFTFTGFGQVNYILTKESDKVLIIKSYYYNGKNCKDYKAIRREDLNEIKP